MTACPVCRTVYGLRVCVADGAVRYTCACGAGVTAAAYSPTMSDDPTVPDVDPDAPADPDAPVDPDDTDDQL